MTPMPEIRKDPVVGRWVVFSPERLHRPMNYGFTRPDPGDTTADPFLAGNEAFTPPEVYAVRDGGSEANTPGWSVRVVPNRYPALRVEGSLEKEAVGFYDRMNGIGAHEVVIETPLPDKELEELELTAIVNVLKAWRARMLDLMKDGRFRYLLVFKNVGPIAGASMTHAHSQIIALPVTPIVMKEKLIASREYFLQKDRNLFEDILRNELKAGERMVYENAGFGVFCPFASRCSFEVCVMPKQQQADFPKSGDHDLVLLADALKKVLDAYRVGLDRPNYNLVLHTAPLRWPRAGHWQTLDFDFRWHIEIIPRLTGVAGFELGTGFYINPVLPESAAHFLRNVKHGA
jgi:UDPglucose--hexose-1-phosphate uridylyltransferase